MLVAGRMHSKAVILQRRRCEPGFAAVMAMDPYADLHGMMMAISSVGGLNCAAEPLAFALLMGVAAFLAVKSWGKPAALSEPDRQPGGFRVQKRQLQGQGREAGERIAGEGQPRLEHGVRRGYRRHRGQRFRRGPFRWL